MGVVIPAGVDRFSRQLHRLMTAAQELALADGAEAVTTGHLLLALAQTDRDSAAFLHTVNTSPAGLRRSLAQAPTTEEFKRRRFRLRRRLPLTAAAEATLLYAIMLAGRARRATYEHVLAGLCRGTPSQAQDVLDDLGVKPSDVRVFFTPRRRHAA